MVFSAVARRNEDLEPTRNRWPQTHTTLSESRVGMLLHSELTHDLTKVMIYLTLPDDLLNSVYFVGNKIDTQLRNGCAVQFPHTKALSDRNQTNQGVVITIRTVLRSCDRGHNLWPPKFGRDLVTALKKSLWPRDESLGTSGCVRYHISEWLNDFSAVTRWPSMKNLSDPVTSSWPWSQI